MMLVAKRISSPRYGLGRTDHELAFLATEQVAAALEGVPEFLQSCVIGCSFDAVQGPDQEDLDLEW